MIEEEKTDNRSVSKIKEIFHYGYFNKDRK